MSDANIRVNVVQKRIPPMYAYFSNRGLFLYSDFNRKEIRPKGVIKMPPMIRYFISISEKVAPSHASPKEGMVNKPNTQPKSAKKVTKNLP